MSAPGSWKILLGRVQELENISAGMRSMEKVLEDKLKSTQERHRAVKNDMQEIEDSLKMLGWMPEKAEQ